ncbi:TM2 domain-containing protein [Senegalia massiliensis]|jgi:TM2 domain-containing membrane protein YozV|uniref:TM2 domain-containing protein n=1 Tax=Senegalia massiliensis TaxID=1720316 RepID=UPI0010311881|nr:TM2 domain-containing protein [Senegalia massiliensis]
MKNKFIAGLLAIFLGGFGIHKFYLGQTGQGIFMLLFAWTGIPEIIGIIQGILLLVMTQKEFDRKYN